MNTTHMAPGALRAELPPTHDGARHPHQAHTAEVLSFSGRKEDSEECI